MSHLQVARRLVTKYRFTPPSILTTQLYHTRRPLSMASTPQTTSLGSALNIPKWSDPPSPSPPPSQTPSLTTIPRLEENAHLLKPPINNHLIYNDPLTVQIVGGPNARTDYHINSTPEFFYQHTGRMLLKTIEHADTPSQRFKDIYIDEGSLFLLPGNTPHNPVRFADTVGVVLELPRPEGSEDRLRWYCQSCGEKVYETAFFCTDLGTQIKSAVQAFEKDVQARTCGGCGEVCDVKPKPEVMEEMRRGGTS